MTFADISGDSLGVHELTSDPPCGTGAAKAILYTFSKVRSKASDRVRVQRRIGVGVRVRVGDRLGF